MKHVILNAFLALLVMASVSLAVNAADTDAAPHAVVGQAAPDFTGTDSNGTEQKLSNYKGKIVVLEWTNPDCPYVKKHYESKSMQSLQKDATAENMIWLRINSGAVGKEGHQTADEANQYATENGVAATATILDESGTIGKKYGAKTTPHMFVIDEAGTLVYAGAIDSIPSTDVNDVHKAHNYVTDATAAITGGRPVKISQTQPYGCGVKYAD